jgi:hypothetical protein
MYLNKLSALWVVALIVAGGCGPSLESAEKMEKKLIQNATTQIPCVKEFHQIWPLAGIGVYSHQFQKGTTQIQITDVVHDRYELTLTIGIEVNPRTLTIKSYEAPLITLLEVTSVVSSAQSGQIRVSYGKHFQISPSQWQKIVQANGQFSAAGIPVQTNEPVAGISHVRERARRL